jgi:copper chaperone
VTHVAIEVDGMTCGHCVRALTEALQALPGVSGLDVAVGRARFEAPAPPDEAALRGAVEGAGFVLRRAAIRPAP